MGNRIDKPLRGLGILAPLNLATLSDDQTTAPARGAGPGNAETADAGTRLEPAISGGQTKAIEVVVRRGGMPQRDGAEVLWRLDTESADPYALRGLSPPNLQAQWIAVKWDALEDWRTFDLVVTEEGQQAVILYMKSSDPADPIYCKRFDFSAADPAWGPEVAVSVDPYDSAGSPDPLGTTAVAGVALPGGRILAAAKNNNPPLGELNIYASDDAGASWFPYAVPIKTQANIDGVRFALEYYRGDLVFFDQNSLDGGIQQIASNSLGTSFEFIADAADVGTAMTTATLPGDGGILLGYRRWSDNLPAVRVLASAFEPYTDASEILIHDFPVNTMCISVDAIGNVWAFGVLTAAPNSTAVWLSADSGATWIRQDENLHDTGNAGTYFQQLGARFCRGWLVLGHSWIGANAAATDGGLGTLWAAGWSSFGSNSHDMDKGNAARTSWAGRPSLSLSGSTGIPIELPQDSGWSFSGLGGTPTLEAPGVLELSSASGGQITLTKTLGVLARGQTWMMETKVISGGHPTIGQIRWAITRSTGLVTYVLGFRFDPANQRVRVIDGGSGSGVIIAEIPMDPSDWIQIVGFVESNGDYLVAYKRPWETKWRAGPSDFVIGLTDQGAGTLGQKGTINTDSSAGVVAHWRQWVGREEGIDGLGFGFGLAPLSGRGLGFGGAVSTIPRPIPEAGSEAAAAFLSAQRGPGRQGESYTIAPVYEYGVDRIFSEVSPSPAEPFRSIDAGSEVSIGFAVFDLTIPENTALGPVWQWAFGFIACNFKTAIIEYRTPPILTWTTAGTYNAAAGFEGLGYERSGEWMRPTAGSIAAGRQLRRNELAGGFAILAAGVARKIAGNSAGGWINPATGSTAFPHIRLEGIDGTEPASGLADLVFPSGVLSVAHSGPQPTTRAKLWRIRIPVQDLADPYVQIGNFVPTTVAVFGKQWARGWSRQMAANTSRRKSRFGTIRKRKQGPPARRWSMGWADGVNEGKARELGGDYLAQDAGGTPLAIRDDVWTLLYGLLEETDGGAAPVLAIASIPPGVASINDRTLFMYGTWDSSVQANQVQGDEGIREFLRIDPIAVSELK